MKIRTTSFTQLEFHESFVLSQPKEGVVLEELHINKILQICREEFGNAPFVYLSLRLADYNVDPLVYLNLEKIRNLKGIGIICSRHSCVQNANFEKRFSKVPFEVFLGFEEATAWAFTQLEK